LTNALCARQTRIKHNMCLWPGNSRPRVRFVQVASLFRALKEKA
jgi:hypothetical protein